jgi:hypothetical protein
VRVARDLAPRQIVLIDGIFYHGLSVWHRELVYAMLEGIVCIGAASMGALRAAELYRYGMIGVGQIFERYRDGEEDDSLVALSYNPETYRPLDDPPISNAAKQADAIQAIEFARGYKEGVKTTLERTDTFDEYLAVVLDRLYDGSEPLPGSQRTPGQ